MPKKESLSVNIIDRSASFSKCHQYRYLLTRRWELGGDPLVWIMCNPSTADDVEDDPTIRRCIRFAHGWGYPGISVVNLFAWRASYPEVLKTAEDPVGLENDEWIQDITQGRDVIAAWGVMGEYQNRGEKVSILVAPLARQFSCLGITHGGHPRHPLYVRSDTVRFHWMKLCTPTG